MSHSSATYSGPCEGLLMACCDTEKVHLVQHDILWPTASEFRKSRLKSGKQEQNCVLQL